MNKFLSIKGDFRDFYLTRPSEKRPGRIGYPLINNKYVTAGLKKFSN